EEPKNGQVVVDEKTGEYTYTPNEDFNGDDKFTVVVSDGKGGEVTVTVPVIVTPVNDDPTAKPEQGFTTDEDTEHKGQIVAEDKDGDELTYKVGEEPKNGSVVVDEKTGEYTYMPNEDFNGDDTFTVVVSDGKGGEVTVTVPVTVTPVNDAPDLDDAEVTVKQGVKDPVIYDVNDASTGKDEDVDGDKLTYAITKGNEDGLFVIDPNTGIITLADGKMLDHGKAPQHQLEVTATDNSSDQLSSTATITVNVSNESKITTEITLKGTITGTTDNVEKGPVKLTITGTDKDGQPVTIERTVELDRPDGSSEGKYTYQLTHEDGIVDGSKVTVEASVVDRQGDTIHADTELPGYSDEDKTPGLDIVEPTIEITTSAGGHKVIWSEGSEGDLSNSSKQGFTIDGTTTGVEAGQKVTVTLDQTADGKPITVEAIVDEEGKWSAEITPDIAAILKDGSATVTVSDRAGNSTEPKTIDYTVDAPSANVTGYYDNIENVLNTVVTEGEVSKTVMISSEIDPNLASNTSKTMVGETIAGDHGTFTLDASGKWTYTLNSGEETSKALLDSKGPLTEIFTVKDSDGKPYEVKVSINDRVKDDGENVVVSATTSSLKDQAELVESDGGEFTIYTNDSLGEITGTVASGVEKVRVYINKKDAANDSDKDTIGYPQYLEIEVNGDGTWSLSEDKLTEVLQTTWWADQLNNDNIYLQVRAVDPATGKVGDVSEKYTFVVDTVAPEATYVNYEDGKVTALVSGDPDDTHHAETGNEVIVKYTDTDGNVQVVTGKVGDKAVADKPYLSISVDVNDSSKVDSNTEFKVYVKDNAGNIGVNNDSKENPLKIELPTPKIDQYHDNVNNAEGGTEIIGNTGYSDDPSGLISGTIVLTEEDLKVVDSVRVYLYDNREKYIEIDKNDLVKGSDNTYRWTTKPGDLSKVTTTGKFAEGEVTLYAATYDKDSGSLSELSPPFKVTIDVTAPEITIESIAEDGIVSQSEKDKGFSIKGSATGVEEGNTVTVDFNGKTYEGTVTNVKNGHGSWEIKIPSHDASTLEDGKTQEATATVTDNAGNTSDPSSKSAKIHLTVLASTELIEIDEDSGPVTGQVTQTGYSLYHKLASEVPPEIGVVEFDSYAYSGQFTFTPAKDWSGTFEFDILVRDAYGNENIVKQIIKVNPVADEPTLSMDMNFDVGELSLNKYVWKEVGYKSTWRGLEKDTTYKIGDKTYNFHNTVGDDGRDRGHGSGINETTLVDGINALLAHKKPDSHDLTNDMKSEGWIDNDRPGEALAAGDVVFINGLVYLEAGKEYKYEGKADDSAMIKIGDDVSSKYVSWQGLGNQGLAEDLFTVEESGFYTFDLYIYNQDGYGNYNFKVTEADGTNVKYFPNIEAAQKEVSGLVYIDDTLQGSDGKGFYGVKFGYTGSETDNVDLEGVAASLTDRDGSETLSMTLTGLVEGTQLSYTAVDMNGKEVLKSAIADADGTITVNGADGVLDFKDLSLDLPKGIATGTLNVELTVTATEKGNGDAKSTSTTFDVNVVKPTAAAKFMLDESDEGDMSELLSAADALQAETPVAFNAALGLSVPTAEMDAPKWAPEFAEGLLSDADTGAYINVNVDEASETVTLSTDQASDEVGSIDAPMLLVADTHDPISFEDLLNHDLTSII
ncbi:MAG: tandem-95 repeat protein, partial [Xanthomonadaceae bacterium]|nr:tandem-95 repeat protein [Xanthomonadaceae bacterium]